MGLLPPPPAEYKIVDVQRHAVFAGKLGQRVTEDVTLERGETRIVVRVAGAYHTMCVREGSRLHAGDTVTIRGEVGSTVARDRIRKVRP